MMQIAILGATGHVAKATMAHLRPHAVLTHVARNADKVRAHLAATGGGAPGESGRILDFPAFESDPTRYDGIVNCVGIGTPAQVLTAGIDLYRVTERMDELCLRRLERHPATVYVNVSSGAVYGTAHEGPIGPDAIFTMDLNVPRDSDHYRLIKLHAERKHRAWTGANIIDLRLFSFCSEFIDLSSSYLVCDIIRSLRSGQPLATGPGDIIRDYIHPSDLADLMLRATRSPGLNTAVDAFSRKAVRKSELLAAVTQTYGLEVSVSLGEVGVAPTGAKAYYVSGNQAATGLLGFQPQWESLGSVLDCVARCLAR